MQSALRGGNGIAFLVAAGIVYEIIAAACSSPQTTEINASARAGTLMKWVNLGVGQAVLFILIAAAIDRQHRPAIVAGGAIAAGLMYAQYAHAKAAGLRNGGPPTESYGASGWGGMK
jgi:hypothetical protein